MNLYAIYIYALHVFTLFFYFRFHFISAFFFFLKRCFYRFKGIVPPKCNLLTLMSFLNCIHSQVVTWDVIVACKNSVTIYKQSVNSNVSRLTTCVLNTCCKLVKRLKKIMHNKTNFCAHMWRHDSSAWMSDKKMYRSNVKYALCNMIDC